MISMYGLQDLSSIVYNCLKQMFRGDVLFLTYRQISNIRRTKSQKLTVYRLVLLLPLPNPLKQCVKSRMTM